MRWHQPAPLTDRGYCPTLTASVKPKVDVSHLNKQWRCLCTLNLERGSVLTMKQLHASPFDFLFLMIVKFTSPIIAHINIRQSFSNIPPFPPLAVFIAAHPSRSHRPCPGFAVLVLGPIVVERYTVLLSRLIPLLKHPSSSGLCMTTKQFSA